MHSFRNSSSWSEHRCKNAPLACSLIAAAMAIAVALAMQAAAPMAFAAPSAAPKPLGMPGYEAGSVGVQGADTAIPGYVDPGPDSGRTNPDRPDPNRVVSDYAGSNSGEDASEPVDPAGSEMRLPGGTIPNLGINQVREIVLNADNDHVAWLSFTPSRDGLYGFKSLPPATSADAGGDGDADASARDPKAALYELAGADGLLGLVQENDDAADSDFRIVSYLNGGSTYYLACRSYGDADVRYNVQAFETDANDLANLQASLANASVWTDCADLYEALGPVVEDPFNADEEGAAKVLTYGVDYGVGGWYRQATDDEGEPLYDADGNPRYEQCSYVPREAGEYRLCLRGLNDYKGECVFDFGISNAYDLGNYTVEPEQYSILATDYPMNGARLKLQFLRSDGQGGMQAVDLVENVDYRLTDWCETTDEGEMNWLNEAPTMPGHYSVSVEGKGNYEGSSVQDVEFQIAEANDVSAASIKQVKDSYPCDGGHVVPVFPQVIAVDGQDITAHCTVEIVRYEDDGSAAVVDWAKAPGSYAVVATGSRDGYVGTVEHPFEVFDYRWNHGDAYAYRTWMICPIVSVGESFPIELPLNEGCYDRWLCVNPDASGTYVFSFYGQNCVPCAGLYESVSSDDASVGDYDLLCIADSFDVPGGAVLEAELEAGRSYYVVCSVEGSPQAATFQFAMGKSEEHNLALHSVSSELQILSGSTAPMDALDIEVLPYEDESGEDAPLVCGRDYWVQGWYNADGAALAAPPTAAGNYFVRLYGISPYYGWLDVPFEMRDPRDLSADWWSAYCPDMYEGQDAPLQDVSLSLVERYAESLNLQPQIGRDYEISGWLDEERNRLTGAPAQPGSYWLELKGIGDYFNCAYAPVILYATGDIAGCYPLIESAAVKANGKPVTLNALGVALYEDSELETALRYGIDYVLDAWVSAETDEVLGVDPNNGPSEIGVYYARLKGVGPTYSGTVELWFEIVEKASNPDDSDNPDNPDNPDDPDNPENPDTPKTAAEQLAAAQEAYDKLQQQYADQEKAVQSAQAALDEATAAKTAADESLAQKQAALDEADAALTAAVSERDAAQADKATAAENIANAQSAIASAQSAVDAATAEKQQADQAVASAEQAVSEAQAKLAAAQEQIQKGSFGFFEHVGATAALNALNREGFNNTVTNGNGKKFTDYVKKGDAKDATSLDSMKESLEWIKYANQIRTSEGMSVFVVTDELMASAQANADYSAVIYDHASNRGSNLRNNAENLYRANIGVERAYQGWYYNEKQAFDNAVAQDPSLEQYRYNAFGLYTANPSVYMRVGHYLNFIWPNSTMTGIGLCYNNGTAAIQHFGASSYGQPTFTVDQYEKRFMDYYNSVKGDPERALAEAQAALEAAQATQQAKADALAAAQAALGEAETAKANAESALAAAEAAIAAGNTKVADAERAKAAAQGNLNTARDAANTAARAVSQKQATLEAEQQKLAAIGEKLAQAKQKLDEAQARYDAEQALAAAQQKAQDDLKAAAEAQAAVDKAAEEAKAAQEAAEASLKEAEQVQDKASDEAQAKSAEAKRLADEAQAKAAEAKRLADEAQIAAAAAADSAQALKDAVEASPYATDEQKSQAQTAAANAGDQAAKAAGSVASAVQAETNAQTIAESAKTQTDAVEQAVKDKQQSSGDTPGGDTPGGDTPGGGTTPGGDTPGGSDNPGSGSNPVGDDVSDDDQAAADLSGASISGLGAKTYTGKTITPAPVVVLAGKTLVAGKDYTVSYKNNVQAGTATITVLGKGAYGGQQSAAFTIGKAKIATAKFNKVKPRKLKKKGKAVKPKIVVKFNGKTLKKNKDYKVVYKNNKKKGTAKAIVKGKGNFKGKKVVKFKIK
ncbi:MAG TPA: hypothetical protein DCP91_03380 [Eggerthellaceae bacterium]|nr:hypothetical protein [Eggerthellaceae bacterium]